LERYKLQRVGLLSAAENVMAARTTIAITKCIELREITILHLTDRCGAAIVPPVSHAVCALREEA